MLLRTLAGLAFATLVLAGSGAAMTRGTSATALAVPLLNVTVNHDGSLHATWTKDASQDSYELIADSDQTASSGRLTATASPLRCSDGTLQCCPTDTWCWTDRGTPLYCYAVLYHDVTGDCPVHTDLGDPAVSEDTRPLQTGATYYVQVLVEDHCFTTLTCGSQYPTAYWSNVVKIVDNPDVTPPVLSLPSDQTHEATGPGGAAATFSASATDAIDGATAVTCTPASGSTFAIGATKVTCTSSDKSGNTATGSFTVTVRDTTPPTLTVSGAKTVTATDAKGAHVSYPAAHATDIVDGAVAAHCTPASGSEFNVGTTKVTCTAKDKHGNSATRSFTVTVKPAEKHRGG